MMGSPQSRVDEYGSAVSSQSIPSQDATTATSLTVPASARSALVSAQGDCEFRVDGTDPTATVGHPLLAGQSFEVTGQIDMSNFAIISKSGTVGVFVTYFK